MDDIWDINTIHIRCKTSLKRQLVENTVSLFVSFVKFVRRYCQRHDAVCVVNLSLKTYEDRPPYSYTYKLV